MVNFEVEMSCFSADFQHGHPNSSRQPPVCQASGNAIHAVHTQLKVLYVGNYLNPNFDLFPQVSCSIGIFFYASCPLRMRHI